MVDKEEFTELPKSTKHDDTVVVTAFQQKVYDATRLIPCGEVITYGELARRIGCKSAQAVGQALRRNPFAPEVPCHRVVASDGRLCGFAGHRDGELIEKKRKLLENEDVIFDGDKVLADKINVRH